MRNDNVINVVINVVKVDTHFAAKSELFVVKDGSFDAKKECLVREFCCENEII